MRPRAGERHIQMITILLRFVGSRAVAFHPIAERIFLSFEFAALGLFRWELRHAWRSLARHESSDTSAHRDVVRAAQYLHRDDARLGQSRGYVRGRRAVLR